jgi:shikimate kinase
MNLGEIRNIGLIGFMGTGKTTIGKALADVTQKEFFDTDTIVERMTGKTIPEIFLKEGEESFRDIESRVVLQVCENVSSVISFGGGVILSTANIEAIRRSCIVVLLEAKVDTILQRTSSNNRRPLLRSEDDDDVENQIRFLLNSRRDAYESSMDFSIETDELSIEQSVDKIIGRVKP